MLSKSVTGVILLALSLAISFGSQALLMMPVECDVVTLSEQRHSERSQWVTVMDDGWTMRGQDSRQEMRSGGRAAGQTHSGRSVALKPRVSDGYDASSDVPETLSFSQVLGQLA